MTYRQRLAQIHFAMGHARRLRLLEILESSADGYSFEELSARSKINHSTLGHHMKVLGQAGFLIKTIKGPYSIYRYDPSPLVELQTTAPLKAAA